MQQAGIELAPEEVLTLVRRTEGWPAGLHLAALSMRGRKGDRADAENFAGDDRFVSEYVREEFLSVLPADEAEFLTRTSVLERLSGSLCDAVLEREGSAAMLARLARSNVMLVALDRSQTSYRYHSLFADVLRSELRCREPDQEAGLHRRAGEWCESHGDAAGAIDHAIAAHESNGPDASRGAARSSTWGVELTRRSAAGSGRFTEDAPSSSPILALAAAGSSPAAGDLYEADRQTSLADRATRDTDVVEAGVAINDRAAIGRQGVARMGSDAARAHALLDPDSPWSPPLPVLRGGGAAPHRRTGPARNGFRRLRIARLCRRRCSRRSASLSWRSWRPTRATRTSGRPCRASSRAGQSLRPGPVPTNGPGGCRVGRGPSRARARGRGAP